ncbi:MAG: hypothetical protein ACJAS9_002369 [Polaribacter sp.]|jgi:hypothetical protein
MIDHKTITETLSDILPGDVDLLVNRGQMGYIARFNWPISNDPSRQF